MAGARQRSRETPRRKLNLNQELRGLVRCVGNAAAAIPAKPVYSTVVLIDR